MSRQREREKEQSAPSCPVTMVAFNQDLLMTSTDDDDDVKQASVSMTEGLEELMCD